MKCFHSFCTDFAYFLFQNTSHSYKSLEHVTNLVWVTWGVDLLLVMAHVAIEVKKIPSGLDTSKATRVDGILAKVLKPCTDELSYPLSLLVNMSANLVEVPTVQLKDKRTAHTHTIRMYCTYVYVDIRVLSFLYVPLLFTAIPLLCVALCYTTKEVVK